MKTILLILPLVFCLMTSCQDNNAVAELEEFKTQAELEEQNVKLIQKVFEQINTSRNIQVYDEVCDPEYSFYSPSVSPDPLSIAEVKGFAEMILKAFPDANYTIKKIFADGDHVIVWNVFKGTHEGEFQGIPATGKKIKTSSILIFHIQNGKIIEEREEYDLLGVMVQLGMELRMKDAVGN